MCYDGGVGMLSALGFRFLDENGSAISGGAAGLEKLASISVDDALPELKECNFRIACDVTNPLFGNWGAAYIFGPQKGASPQDVKVLDDASRSFAAVTQRYTGHDLSQTAGAGAAGGMGFAFLAYLHGRLRSTATGALSNRLPNATCCCLTLTKAWTHL